MQVECLPWADETFSRIIGAQMLLTRQPLGWQTRGRMDIDEAMLSAHARQCRVNLTRAARAFATGRRACSNDPEITAKRAPHMETTCQSEERSGGQECGSTGKISWS